jgi:hypothetical protein
MCFFFFFFFPNTEETHNALKTWRWRDTKFTQYILYLYFDYIFELFFTWPPLNQMPGSVLAQTVYIYLFTDGCLKTVCKILILDDFRNRLKKKPSIIILFFFFFFFFLSERDFHSYGKLVYNNTRDLIHTQHHHNNHTITHHMSVDPSVWGPLSCEWLLCGCCIGIVNLTFSIIQRSTKIHNVW